MRKEFLMGFPLQRKGLALLLLLLMTSITLGGAICLGADHHPAPAAADTVASHAGGEAPCCPDDGHGNGGHCLNCLSCPCQAPLAGDELCLSYAPSIHVLSFSERRVPPPDVYLSKFVPPAESRLTL